jgi:hypothetical protein
MISPRLPVGVFLALGLGAGCSSMADRPFFARFRAVPVESCPCSAPVAFDGPALGDCGPAVPAVPTVPLTPVPPPSGVEPIPGTIDDPTAPRGAPRLVPVPNNQAPTTPAGPSSRTIFH